MKDGESERERGREREREERERERQKRDIRERDLVVEQHAVVAAVAVGLEVLHATVTHNGYRNPLRYAT